MLQFKTQANSKRKTPTVLVFNEDDYYLGTIGFRPQWRCFVWNQVDTAVMSATCLQELTDKIKEMDHQWRHKTRCSPSQS